MSSVFDTCAETIDFETSTADFIRCIAETRTSDTETVTEQVDGLVTGIDTFWLIYGGALVYFMQTGFAMLCAGSIRAKNVKNVILWNLLDSSGGGLAFWAVGYAFAYGGDDGGKMTFIGNTNFFLSDPDTPLHFWFFQFAFACALSSIVAGTIAERTKMAAYLLYSVFLAGFVYPVVAHAFWSTNGFLSNLAAEPLWDTGIIDLAGSGPVHMCGGVAALWGAIILGPRRGRFYDEDGNPLEEPNDFPPHSVTLQFLGTFCLWFGWYGFNPASSLIISTSDGASVAARAAVNTTLSACAGAVTAMFLSTLYDIRQHGIAQWDLAYTMNGCLTGLVAITAPCATVETWAAVIIGMFAGLFYLIGSKLLVRFRIDDAVDAVPVHMVGGAWGVIATGLFSKPSLMATAFGMGSNAGWFYEWSEGSGDFTLLGIQLIGVLFIFAWTSFTMGGFFYILNVLGMFRISALEEEVGMDISRHKGACYTMDGPAPEKIEELNSSRHSSVKKIPAPVETAEKEGPVASSEEERADA